jgi:hypothetical protein
MKVEKQEEKLNAFKTFQFYVIITILVLTGVCAEARIKLVSLPERELVVIRLDNPQGTLVEEDRILTLQKGINQVDFSWNEVGIDPESIRLTLLSHPDRVKLLSVSYPPSESALIWEIASEEAWEERVRVSYLLKNIDSLITYKALSDQAERQIELNGYLILRNFSGEDFENASIFFILGKPFEQNTVHEQTQQMLLFSTPKIPIEKVWTFDSQIQPWDPTRLEDNVGIPVSYRLKNIKENRLGEFGLPQGKLRVFQEDGYESSIFLGEDTIDYIPIGENAMIRIGDSRDIVINQQKLLAKNINVRRNEDNMVVLYDTEEKINAKLENFKDQPALLTMIQHIPGQWDMVECNMDYTLKDSSTLEFEIRLAPGEKKELNMHYHRRNVR